MEKMLLGVTGMRARMNRGEIAGGVPEYSPSLVGMELVIVVPGLDE